MVKVLPPFESKNRRITRARCQWQREHEGTAPVAPWWWSGGVKHLGFFSKTLMSFYWIPTLHA